MLTIHMEVAAAFVFCLTQAVPGIFRGQSHLAMGYKPSLFSLWEKPGISPRRKDRAYPLLWITMRIRSIVRNGFL